MQEIGGPVVVKPRDGNQGKGVTVNIGTREQLEAAYATAAEFRDDVMVEEVICRAAITAYWWSAEMSLPPPAIRRVIGDGIHSGPRAGGQGQCRSAPQQRTYHIPDADPLR